MIRPTSRLSEHTVKEIDHAVRVGHRPGDPPPLKSCEAVLGCVCGHCTLATFNLSDDARIVAEDLIRDLARLNPAIRQNAAAACVVSWFAEGVRLPSAGILAELSKRVPGARRSIPRRTDDPLPISKARRADILQVCERHGVRLRKVGRSHRGPCPIHRGTGPNFSVDAELSLYYCYVCDSGGDVISLEQQLSGVDFPNVVRRLAG